MEPVEGEDRCPISQNPRLKPPAYVRMPGRPKQNNRKREDHEKPKGYKMTRVGIQMRCSVCHKTGHNKVSCLKKKEIGRNTSAFIAKAGKKIKATEQAETAYATTGSQSSQATRKKQVPSTTGRKRKNPENANMVKEKMAMKK